MRIYLDYVFIENFVMDLLLLKQTEYLSKSKFKLINLIIASVISSLYVVIMIGFNISELNWLICKILLVVVTCYIAFKPKGLARYLKLIMLFFLVSIINVGTVMVIRNLSNIQELSGLIKIAVYFFTYLISKHVISSLWKIYERNIKLDDLVYDVKITIKGKGYTYKAFIDTGNNVYSYSEKIPIIFAELQNEEILCELQDIPNTKINTVTLSSTSEKTAYIIEDIQIVKGDNSYKVRAGVVFEKMNLSRTKDYNMILNYKLFNDQMGGINI